MPNDEVNNLAYPDIIVVASTKAPLQQRVQNIWWFSHISMSLVLLLELSERKRRGKCRLTFKSPRTIYIRPSKTVLISWAFPVSATLSWPVNWLSCPVVCKQYQILLYTYHPLNHSQHHLHMLITGGKLHLAPVGKDIQSVLDCGTGILPFSCCSRGMFLTLYTEQQARVSGLFRWPKTILRRS